MSKGLEALEYVKHKLSELEFVLRHNNQKAPYIEETEWNIIGKELKVLEVLRKHAKCEPMIPGEREPDIVIMIQCEADEEYKAVEEWLRGEKK